MASTQSGITALAGSDPSQITSRSLRPSRRATVDGERFSRSARTATVTAIPTTTKATMPMVRRTPKSRIIGTFEISMTRNAAAATTVASASGGPTRDMVSEKGELVPRSVVSSSWARLWI